MVPGGSKACDQLEQDVRWTFLWYLAVAKHVTNLKTRCEVDHCVVPGGSKDMTKLKTRCEVDHFVVPGGSKAFDQTDSNI